MDNELVLEIHQRLNNMKIPKKIQTLLDRRECLAYQLSETCCKFKSE